MTASEAAMRAARLGDEISHGWELLGMVAGALVGAAIIVFTAATGGLALAAIVGVCIAVGGLGGGMIARGIMKAANLSGPTSGLLANGSPNVFINGKKAMRATLDFAPACSGLPCNHYPYAWPMAIIAQGAKTVFINGAPMARVSMKLICGAKVKTGSENVFVGGPTATVAMIWDFEKWFETGLQVLGVVALGAAFAGAVLAGGVVAGALFLGTIAVFNVAFSALYNWGESLGPGWGDIFCGSASILLVLSGPKIAKNKSQLKFKNTKEPKLTTETNYEYIKKIDNTKTTLGDPVHAVTGTKFLDGSDDLDFSLPSRLPITWERRYSGLDTREDGPFGTGWSTPYSVQLKTNQPGDHPNVFVDDHGAEIFFPALEPGESALNTVGGYGLAFTAEGQMIVEGRDGLYRDFGELSESGPHILNLQGLEDRNGNRIDLRRTDEGVLSGMTDSAGNLVECIPDLAHPRRIAHIRVRRPDADNPEQWRTLARYAYDEAGRLTTVTNALGHVVRRFTHHAEGPGQGLVASHTLPTGLVCRYDWRMFDHPRVVRLEHSDGQSWDISYDIEAGRTTAIDSLGRREEWTWDRDFNLLSYTDALGQTTRLEWNETGQLASKVEPSGGVWKYDYDSNGLLVKTIDPLGGESGATWDQLSMQPLTVTDPAGREYAYKYDYLGNLIGMTDPLGRVTEFDRDDSGQVCDVKDPLGGVTHLEWNDAGQLIRRVDRSGNSTTYEYDAQDNLKSVTDAERNVTTYDLDAMGQPLGLTLPDGGRRAFAWNTAGLLVNATDAMGGQDHLRYDLNGQVIAYANAKGGRTGYSYDLAGNLTQLRNENGEAYTFEYDAADRQVSQTGLDGISRRWTLDSMGMPIEVREAAGTDAELRVTLERDLLGRLTRKITAETVTAYAYDPAGQLLEARREDLDGAFMDSLHLSYDAVGNLTGEKTVIAEDDGTLVTRELRHEYDPLGNRTRTVMPDGECLSYALNDSGFVHQISVSDSPDGIEQIITAFERDRLQRETLRTQGRRHALSDYDPLSRLTARRSRVRTDLLVTGDLALVNKEYTYDKNGELVGLTDSLTGSQTFAYDALGRVTGSARRSKAHNAQLSDTLATLGNPGQAREALFRDERFTYDEAGNLLNTDGEDLPLTTFGPVRSEQFGGVGLDEDRPTLRQHNRVRRLGRFTFTHDLHGRVVEKLDQDAKITWIYRYDCEHRLIEASRRSRRGFTTTRFRYDLLGRRIVSSTSGRETRFVWNGMQLLQEQRGHQRSTFLYEPGTYAPLARIDADSREATRRMYYFHCTPAGLPEEMTDEEGRIIWRARHTTWGRPIFETTHNAPEGFRQNLRMQGQYDDRDTGLYYNTFRHYDPDTGRFTTEDPIGLLGGMNLYAYAPNPMGWVDPWGWCNAARGTSSAIPESYMNSRHMVNMEPARGLTGSTLNARGEVRNANYFWNELIGREPQMFSKGNLYLVQELGHSPKVDRTWVKFNPTHQGFLHNVLDHHHINQGPIAVPLPQTVHQQWTSVLHGLKKSLKP